MKGKKRIGRSARQLYRFCLVNGALDRDRARQVARHLAETKRRGGLALLSAFLRFVQLDEDRHAALVESAAPLATALREEVQAALTRIYGPHVAASFAENPALIGGMRIKVGSDVYDGSIRGRLAALGSRL
jgi:F-type H+-transporting ATPase subunit delta